LTVFAATYTTPWKEYVKRHIFNFFKNVRHISNKSQKGLFDNLKPYCNKYLSHQLSKYDNLKLDRFCIAE
jgi:hypothetical protein